MKSSKSPQPQLDFFTNDPSLTSCAPLHGQADDFTDHAPIRPVYGPVSDQCIAHRAIQAVLGRARSQDVVGFQPDNISSLQHSDQGLQSSLVASEPLKRKRGRLAGKRNQQLDRAFLPAKPARQPLREKGSKPLDSEAAPLYLSVRSVARRYDVSEATIWRWVASGRFPSPRKLAAGTTRWAIGDLEAFERATEQP
jgi:predicted DNA-binding transcriptional regulator AlpA